jgi:hypothetical protein
MVDEKFESNRVLVESFILNAAVTEVWESRSADGVKIFFDVRESRQFISKGERRRGPFIQQRDIGDLIITLIQAQKYIGDRHSEIRRARYAEDGGRVETVGEGSYGESGDKE